MSNISTQKRIDIDVPLRELLILLLGITVLEALQSRLMPPIIQFRLLLILVLYVSWYGSPLKAAVAGTIFGIIEDFILGTYLGINGLSYTFLGFATAYLSRWVSAESTAARFLILTLAAFFNQLIVLGLIFLLDQWLLEEAPLSSVLIALLTGTAGTIFFNMYDKIRIPPTDFRRL